MKDKLTGDNGGKLDGHVSDEEYLTCNKIWNKFNMKNMGDCHDIDIYLIIEKWLRRGIFYICKRYSEVNNNYMKLCNPTKSSKLIWDLDVKNLCGWGMSKFLTYGGFKWLKMSINLM